MHKEETHVHPGFLVEIVLSPGVSLPRTALLKTFLIHLQLMPNKEADGLAAETRLEDNPGLQLVSVCDIPPLRGRLCQKFRNAQVKKEQQKSECSQKLTKFY